MKQTLERCEGCKRVANVTLRKNGKKLCTTCESIRKREAGERVGRRDQYLWNSGV